MNFGLSLQVWGVPKESDEEVLGGKLERQTFVSASDMSIAEVCITHMLIDDGTGQDSWKADSIADLLDSWSCTAKRGAGDVSCEPNV